MQLLPGSGVKTYICIETVTFMKKTELSLIVITGLLLLLRFIWGVPVNLMLRIMLTLTAVFYLWSGFFLFNRISISKIHLRQTFKGINAFKIATGIGMGGIYSVALISVMYAINFYSGMNFLLGFSVFCLFMSGSFFTVYYFLNPETIGYVKQYFIRNVVLILITGFMLSLSVDKRLEILYHEYPEFIEAYKTHRDNPDDTFAAEKLKEERSRFR